MKRTAMALTFGAFVTLLPWILRPLFGDRSAILWLPGFFAVSHWFPLGLHGHNAGTAKAVGCLTNVVIWAAGLLLLSFSGSIAVLGRRR